MTAPRTSASAAQPRKRATKKSPAALPRASSAPQAGVGPTSVEAIKQRTQTRRDLLTLPSGIVVRATSPGLMAFITRGLVPNGLLEVIQKAIDTGKTPSPEEVMGDEGMTEERTKQLLQLVDSVTVAVCIEPQVHRVPNQKDLDEYNTRARANEEQELNNPEQLRDPSLLYVDELDDLDKMFLYQWASGGTAQFEEFLEGLQTDMDAVARIPGVQLPAKQPARRRAR